ncbi:MAG: TetR/AcrR family transcriptional regulator [Ruegeria sp.]
MSRPSLKNTRTEEILNAFMRCVARYGLDGSTLARISEEAAVGRPLLRHYLGNREEMVRQLLDHVLRTFDAQVKSLFNSLPEIGRIDALMDAMFDRSAYSPQNAAVFAALVAASDRHQEIRKPLLGFVVDFEDRLASEILRQSPDACKTRIKAVSAGVTAIYFNTDAVMPLQPGSTWREQQRCAAQLLLDAVQ